jgi:hypothetical protein
MYTLTISERDFYSGLGIGLQWADTVHDEATRDRFIDAGVKQCQSSRFDDTDGAPNAANRLAASILGIQCDSDSAAAFWLMVAPGIDAQGMSHWFFEGFIAGAADSFRETHGGKFGELRKMVTDPTMPPMERTREC